MRHERTYHLAALTRRRSGVVECIVKPVRAERSALHESREIFHRGMGIDGEGECRRIRGDYEIGGEPAFQPEVRHAERTVLIGVVTIAQVVRRFGNAPGHSAVAVIRDLSVDRGMTRLVEQ